MESIKPRKPREFTVEFKEAAARRLLAGQSGTALSRELEVKRSVNDRKHMAVQVVVLSSNEGLVARHPTEDGFYRRFNEQAPAESLDHVFDPARRIGRLSRAGLASVAH